MSDLADLSRGIADLQQLARQQGAAMIALLERVAVLERALAFEVQQREALEPGIVRAASLPFRMDHVEREIIELRKLPRGVRMVSR